MRGPSLTRIPFTLGLAIQCTVVLVALVGLVTRAWAVFNHPGSRLSGPVRIVEAAMAVFVLLFLVILGLLLFAQLHRSDGEPTRWPGYLAESGEYQPAGERALRTAIRARVALPPFIVVMIAWFIVTVWVSLMFRGSR